MSIDKNKKPEKGEKITFAVVKVKGKNYKGQSHFHALLNAVKDKKSVKGINKEKVGKFLTNKGNLINRKTANRYYGGSNSEDIPSLHKRQVGGKHYTKTELKKMGNRYAPLAKI